MIEVKVKVVFRKGKGSYVLRWRDPETGAWKEKSCKTTVKKEADKAGAQLEADLQQGRYVEPSKMTWIDFRLRFEEEKLRSLAVKSRNAYNTALNRVENVLHPAKLVELDGPTLSRFQARLRANDLREATIAAYLRHIAAALRWGHSLGLISVLPIIQKPKRARTAKQMRGRPITGEEFERMLAACDKVRPTDAGIWKGFLQGLWLSGLRLSEALSLSWDTDAEISVDLDGEFPCLRIVAEAEKGFRDRQLPLTPDFSEYIKQTPDDLRTGKVFKVAELFSRVDTVSKVVCAIGENASVLVNREQEKFASAHDLRRAFGNRWASKVMPVVLQQLMRHESIETTMKYYVSQSASDIARALWTQLPGQSGTSARRGASPS